MNDLIFTPAHQLARMIKERQVSSVEVLEAHLNQISQHNSRFNAICTLNENTLETAKQADEALAKGENWGVFHGVPITIKDIFETEALRTTAGYKPLENYIPTRDATVVPRLRNAGAIILGKSNTAELAGEYQSVNDIFPAVNNPWNPDYTPGGSSGGSAAAVAAGFSPLDIGNDVSGSIRQPAHFCGVYGLKPTDRRVSSAGQIPEVPGQPKCIRQMQTVGPLARCFADLRLSFTLIAGADIRQPDIAPVPFDTISDKSLQDLRVAWMDGWDELPVACEITSAMQTVANDLTQAGVKIESWIPPLDIEEALQLSDRLIAYNFVYSQPVDFATAKKRIPMIFREMTQGDKNLREISNMGDYLPELLNPTLKGYFTALTTRDKLIAQMDAAMEPWDVWLCPVAMTCAFTHRPMGRFIDVDGRKVPYLLANGAYTSLLNLTGNPVVVIPIGFTTDGLPIGMQIVGKRWKELELLNIAGKLDEIIGGFVSPEFV
ncbi:amidase, Asp-tRNAAsn/Glu-tRNAGln amidotransferase A subunit [Rivularia sp. PCC 7116]|uniref:amidase n=1 Tax=Rivularia sp. PCC 7116 TaxID=373994 RepID=UPI00029EF639|nr:amidase [Rivularia sp. PCC 7116]AFY58441.1 amidase, Asp-tRNAAsn/Glu-tRNAGln amidotransferase A subunit [Rivularia sp. PCC 7116]